MNLLANGSALAPLHQPSFRRPWLAWVAAAMGMWMNDVAAAWVMSSLTNSPLMIALVQTAATMPIFLLGLPSGALADRIERRQLLIYAQIWAAGVALALMAAFVAGVLGPELLLALVFCHGVVLAVRWPTFSALIPELVAREQVPAASALSGMANHGSRLAGPLLAGLVLTSVGPGHLFLLTALIALGSAGLMLRWSHAATTIAPSRPFLGSIVEGFSHACRSRPMRPILLRVCAFFFNAVAFIALLPLVARSLPNGTGASFTLLVAAMGAGAIVVTFALPSANRRLSSEVRYMSGGALSALASMMLAVAPGVGSAVVASFAAGSAYMLAVNTLAVAGTQVLPPWVRARGLAVFQMAVMGSSALGAASWGYAASLTNVGTSLVIACATGLASLVAARSMIPWRTASA